MTSVADLGNNERRYSVSLSSCLARAHYQTRQGWLFAARAPQRCGRHHDRDRSFKGRSQRRKRRRPSEGRLTPAYTLRSHANPIERRPAGRVQWCMCLCSCLNQPTKVMQGNYPTKQRAAAGRQTVFGQQVIVRWHDVGNVAGINWAQV
jgi:hypothetical protein